MQKSRIHQRTNKEWVEELSDPVSEDAVVDLGNLLFRGLRAPLSGILTEDLDSITNDFIQQTLIEILGQLHTFNGDCNFLTWALKILIHNTFTELRYERWIAKSILLVSELPSSKLSIPLPLRESGDSLELEGIQSNIFIKLGDLIENELTNQQYAAIHAFYHCGMPVHEGARQLGVSCNSFNKLLQSARKRLKWGLTSNIGKGAYDNGNYLNKSSLISYDHK